MLDTHHTLAKASPQVNHFQTPAPLPSRQLSSTRRSERIQFRAPMVQWKQLLDRVVDAMQSHPESRLFKDPVENVANYLETLQERSLRPICLREITQKIKDRQYATWAEFEADVQLLFLNAAAFNGHLVRAPAAP
jgi:hypothetical protein